MEDELKEACQGYVQGNIPLTALKLRLRALLNDASQDDMLEFCHTVIEGLREEKGH